MRFLIQRVTRAAVRVDAEITGKIDLGLLVFIGMGKQDNRATAEYLVEKVLHLRIFQDAEGRMNRSVLEAGGGLLLVSQFTLYGDTRKGRRPSFDLAASPEQAKELYDYVVEFAKSKGVPVETGSFGAHMEVELVNDGPVTFLLED